LNKLRDLLEPTLTKIGASFASTGLSANFWTGLGLAVSVLAAIAYSSNVLIESEWSPWNFASVIGGIFLLLSGFFDIVDGSVARITKRRRNRRARRTTANHCDNRYDTYERSDAMGNDNYFHNSRYHISSEGGGNSKEIVFYRSLVAVRLSASDLTFTMPL